MDFSPVPTLAFGSESRFAPFSRLGLGRNPSNIRLRLLGGLNRGGLVAACAFRRLGWRPGAGVVY